MDYFAHRIHKATLLNGVVRLEFAVLKPDESGNYNPDVVRNDEVTFSVNLPMPGFARSMATMRELMKDLQQKGLLKGGESAEGAGPAQPQQGRNASMRDLTRDDDASKPIV
jgi:hypothetical protein